MLLTDYVALYADARDLKPGTVDQYRYTAENFERFAGAVPLTSINADFVNRWLAYLKSQGRSSWTIAGNRTRMNVLLSAAEYDKAIERAPKIKRVKKHRLTPSAWSPLELQRLLAACDLEASNFPKCKAVRPPIFWRAYVLTAYYTGMRLADLLGLKWSQIHDGGIIVRLQEKTGVPICTTLPDDCLAAIVTVQAARNSELIFGGLCNTGQMQKRLRKIRNRAGFKTGGSQQLRRTGATAVENAHPGSATTFLGHLTDGLARRHYLDLSKIHRQNPLPPKVG